jgi:hypothetical protein
MIQYLNDAAELKIAISICRSILREELRKTNPSDYAMKDVLGVWSEIGDDLFESTHICVVSFTEQADQLSQWRGYCPPDGGYAIGFRTSSLEACLREQEFVLAPCEYAKSKQNDILKQWVGETISALKEIAQQETNLPLIEAVQANIQQLDVKVEELFIKEFHRIAPIIKHSKFAEEKEWRAISNLDPQLHFRVGRAMLLPYCKIDLKTPRFPIEEFIVGPSPHQKLAGNSLEKFLLSEGIKLEIQPPPPKDPKAWAVANGDTVKYSEIPTDNSDSSGAVGHRTAFALSNSTVAPRERSLKLPFGKQRRSAARVGDPYPRSRVLGCRNRIGP